MNYEIIYITLISILIISRLILLFKNEVFNKLLILFISFTFLMWYIIPFVLTIFEIVYIFDFLDVSVDDYYKLALNEFIFFYLVLLGFSFIKRKKKLNLGVTFLLDENERKSNFLYRTSYIYIIFYIVYTLLFRMDYEFNNQVENQQGGTYQLISFFSFFFISYNWIILIYSESINLRKKSFLLIFILSIVLLLSGSRMHLLSLLFLIYFYLRVEQDKLKRIRNYTIISVLSLFSLMLLPVLGTSRVNNNSLSENLSIENILLMNNLILEELNTKLNSVAYSTVLLKYDGESFAGLNPYKGSLFKFIPRFFWNDKPTPSSYNSSVDGIPSRRIPDLLGNYSDVFNTGTSPYAVSVWQLGIYGVIISILFNILYLIFINILFNYKSLLLKSLGFMLIGFPQFNMLFTTGDNVVQKLEEFFVFALILMFLKYIIPVKIYEDNIV